MAGRNSFNTVAIHLLEKFWPWHCLQNIISDLRQLPLSKGMLTLVLIFSFALPAVVSMFAPAFFYREITSPIEDEAERLARHIDRSLGVPANTVALADVAPLKLEEIAFIVQDFGVLKLRLFAPGGLILHSTDPQEIGRIHAQPDFAAFIRTKKVYSKTVGKDSLTYDGVPATKSVVEVYLPLLRGEEIIGALEIYYDISATNKRIKKFIALSVGLLSFGAALFFLTCYVLLKRIQQNIVKGRQLETFLQGMIDQLEDRIIVLDPEFHVRWMNRAARESMPEHEQGKGTTFCHAVTHGLEAPCAGDDHPCPFVLARDSGKTACTMHVHRDAAGGKRCIEHRATPLYAADGSFAGAIEMIHDRTETIVKEKAQRRRQSQEALERIAAGIGHDFGNLFTAILGNITLAQSQTRESANDLVTSLREAASAGRQAAALTGRLISFARGGEPVRNSVAVTPLVQEEGERLLSGFPVVTLETTISSALWSVYANGRLLGDVVFNILLNAAEAMQGQGVISVTASNLLVAEEGPHASELTPGCYVRLDICDSGHGIAVEHEDIVFEPYFSTKPKGAVKGTGLGLTICHAIVKRHGGAITFVSIPGEGTTFSVFLPAGRPLASVAEPE